MIDTKQTIAQLKGNIVSDMGGEKVMLCIKNGKYYNLGAIGGHIWELMSEPTTIEQLVSDLMSVYAVERSDCEEQVASFLKHLMNEGLIEAC
ncbi:lasso peptide biosynthesis PqqD family chaperone [Paenibacillus cremeus]|nr:lasso peptide biosynthesis PqqD family chaperone [Paenibacillus cremeus]